MNHIHFVEPPVLRNPVLLVAFTGWVDGGDVATTAIRFLRDSWAATSFAEIDPEPFYNFSRVRPQVHLEPDSSRTITWPETGFYYHVDPRLDRDYVLLLGIEPNFMWQTFTREVLEVCQSVGITSMLTIGGVIGDVPHTRPSPITVFTSDPALRARFPELGPRRGGYQGPTGIVGVISAALEAVEIPVGNMRGLVPHYLAGSRNPKVRRELLMRLDALYGLNLNLSDLDKRVQRFERRVNRALADKPELAEYVAGLEKQLDGSEPTTESAQLDSGSDAHGELPSGADIVRELEDFFRGRSAGQSDEEPGPRP